MLTFTPPTWMQLLPPALAAQSGTFVRRRSDALGPLLPGGGKSGDRKLNKGMTRVMNAAYHWYIIRFKQLTEVRPRLGYQQLGAPIDTTGQVAADPLRPTM